MEDDAFLVGQDAAQDSTPLTQVFSNDGIDAPLLGDDLDLPMGASVGDDDIDKEWEHAKWWQKPSVRFMAFICR